MKVGGKILTSDLGMAKIFLKFYRKRLANVFSVSDNRLPIFKPTTFLGHLRYASTNLDLVLPVHKHNSLLAELRSAALATIHERYPDQDWLHVFTDGYTTASFAYLVLSPTLLILKNLLVPDCVSGYNLFPSKLEFECKQLINSFLCTGREVVLQWIPSHCSIHRNEKANKLAKEALTLHSPCFSMPLRNAKQPFRDKFRKKRISTLTDLDVRKFWSHVLNGQRHAQFSALPRCGMFRVITGHDYLQAHLFKIGLADSLFCPLCKSGPMIGICFILDCKTPYVQEDVGKCNFKKKL
ncbi:uncharacterized protein LOC103524116 [Trichonephila clavipes]|nr:uncharacterized protein LOC103524116 [Trichonephila clavipes]